MGAVWGLFAGLSGEQESLIALKSNDKMTKCDYSHTLEIMNSAMNGNISSYSDDFDLKAYEIRCTMTDEIELGTSRKKFLTIVDTVNTDEADSVGYGEISSNKLRTLEDAFEDLENKDEFDKNLQDLYALRRDYMVSEGIDIVQMLYNSLDGIPEAVAEVRVLTEKDEKLKSIVGALCENSRDMLQGKLKRTFI